MTDTEKLFIKGRRVRVKPDALSAWRGDYGRVVTEQQTGMATIALEKDCLQIAFWTDELEPVKEEQ